MTDDLSMGAIKDFTDNINEAVLAVKAGNDILLTSDYYIHYDAVIDAIKKKDISEEIINTACKRIIAWKLKYLLNHEPSYEEKKEDEPDATTLIIVLIVLASLVVGAIIFFLIMWLKNRTKSDEVDIEPQAGLVD